MGEFFMSVWKRFLAKKWLSTDPLAGFVSEVCTPECVKQSHSPGINSDQLMLGHAWLSRYDWECVHEESLAGVDTVWIVIVVIIQVSRSEKKCIS